MKAKGGVALDYTFAAYSWVYGKVNIKSRAYKIP